MGRRRALGRGLDALIPETPAQPGGLREASLDAIAPNPLQPRTHFDEAELQELAASIREMGLIQPLIVQAVPVEAGQAERYQLITGERRWRASRLAGLERVPVVVKDVTPQEMLELALVENIQRADLNPLEEATAYQQLADEFGLTQDRIADRVGRSRASVANTMRLLRLPEEIRAGLLTGEVSEGHARALLMLDDADEQMLAYRSVVRRALSVRQTEELVRRLQSPPLQTGQRSRRSAETEALERRLREALGTKVDLFRSRKGGRVVIHFYSEEELQALLDRMAADSE
ncbi:MAG: ParB/RepB/Spo0J family partition protein [Anaerolineae bacterium]|jgi:ParB family chromosome partitioning protein